MTELRFRLEPSRADQMCLALEGIPLLEDVIEIDSGRWEESAARKGAVSA